jgi:hypothetical protein
MRADRVGKLGMLVSCAFALAIVTSGSTPATEVDPSTGTRGAKTAGGVTTKTLTLPAAAFKPIEDEEVYDNSGHWVGNWTSPGAYYAANVDLPSEAVVTGLSLHWYDDLAGDQVTAWLRRVTLADGAVDNMASVASPVPAQPGGFGVERTTSIIFRDINPLEFSYLVVMYLPEQGDDDILACAVEIEYEYHPLAPSTLLASLSPPAFVPFEDGYEYLACEYLEHLHSPGGGTNNGWYVARLDLPDGATLEGMRFYWLDQDPSLDAVARLQRTELGVGDYPSLAVASSSGSPGFSSTYASISGHVVDNTHYAYWVAWDLPASSDEEIVGLATVISYSAPSPVTIESSVSVSAPAFTSHREGYDYTNSARYLTHRGGGAPGYYVAPLNLPDGAEVLSMTFHWYINTASCPLEAIVQRSRLETFDVDQMATVEPTSGSGFGFSVDDTISYGVIDNSKYSYSLVWTLPATTGEGKACAVVVDFRHGLLFADGFEDESLGAWSSAVP